MFLFFKIKMVNYCLQEINCILTNDVLEYTPHSNHEKFNKRRGVYSNKYGKWPVINYR